jgi:DNA mismatch repair protein MutS
MDEIGRGTSTYDGLSIAWAVAEYLHDAHQAGVKTLFATHYHELTELAHQKKRVKNYNIAVKEWNDEIIFLRKLVEGGTNRSYGIQVARLAGIPLAVVDKAKKILYNIENSEFGQHGSTLRSIAEQKPKSGAVQMDLFRQHDSMALNRLKELDISKLTPLEALNLLNDLQDLVKSGK